MATIAAIYQKKITQVPNGDNLTPPVKPVKYAKAIATKNGTIGNTQQANSSVVNTILAGK